MFHRNPDFQPGYKLLLLITKLRLGLIINK